MSDRVDINEGKTGANGVPAAIAGLVGVVMITINIWISIVFFVFCAIMASVTEGIEFNVSKRKYRKYYNLFGLRSGRWKLIPLAHEVVLRLNIEGYYVRRWLPRGARDSKTVQERIITFDIQLEKDSGQEVFYQFYQYQHARKALETISSILQIPMQDHVEEQIESRQ